MSPLSLGRVQAALASHPRDGAPRNDGAYASVATVMRDAPDGAEVLLIRRATHVADPWSGHMAFPGGRRDPGDTDLVQTALRETQEEVGLDLSRVGTLLGRLDDVDAIARGRRAGLTIAPFVFALHAPVGLRPNYEVAETLWAPLGPLARGEGATEIDYQHDQTRLKLPAWDIRGRIVWGLTYRMLQALIAELG